MTTCNLCLWRNTKFSHLREELGGGRWFGMCVRSRFPTHPIGVINQFGCHWYAVQYNIMLYNYINIMLYNCYLQSIRSFAFKFKIFISPFFSSASGLKIEYSKLKNKNHLASTELQRKGSQPQTAVDDSVRLWRLAQNSYTKLIPELFFFRTDVLWAP